MTFRRINHEDEPQDNVGTGAEISTENDVPAIFYDGPDGAPLSATAVALESPSAAHDRRSSMLFPLRDGNSLNAAAAAAPTVAPGPKTFKFVGLGVAGGAIERSCYSPHYVNTERDYERDYQATRPQGRKAADGCKPRHGRGDRKRGRKLSGLSC